MKQFGNWKLTSEWIESENARIPLDSVSYVGSLDLMKHSRAFFLLAAIFFGLVAIAFLGTGFIVGAVISGILCAIFIYLYGKNSTTFVVISSSGYMIQQTSGEITKDSADHKSFMNALFQYRKDFMDLKASSGIDAHQKIESNWVENTNQVRDGEENSRVILDAFCPCCSAEIYSNAESCPKCHAIFSADSAWKPIKK